MGFIERTYTNVMGFLDGVAETQFAAVAAQIGTSGQILAAIVTIFLLINMGTQTYRIDAGPALAFIAKIVLIAAFMTSWTHFNSIFRALESMFSGVSASMLQSATDNPSVTSFAAALDGMIDKLASFANVTAGTMNILGSVINGIMLVFMALFGAIGLIMLVIAKVVLTLLLSIAPFAIFATLAQATKSYFETWLTALVTFLMFPVILAGVLATVLAMGNQTIDHLEAGSITNLGAVTPILMVIIIGIILFIAAPLVVTMLTGSFQLGGMIGAVGHKMTGSGRMAGRGTSAAAHQAASVAKDTAGYMKNPIANTRDASIDRAAQLSRIQERVQRYSVR